MLQTSSCYQQSHFPDTAQVSTQRNQCCFAVLYSFFQAKSAIFPLVTAHNLRSVASSDVPLLFYPTPSLLFPCCQSSMLPVLHLQALRRLILRLHQTFLLPPHSVNNLFIYSGDCVSIPCSLHSSTIKSISRDISLLSYSLLP